MRLNRYLALATGISRRRADQLIESGRVAINGDRASVGAEVKENDKVTIDGRTVHPQKLEYIVFNKPINYVTSRQRQGVTQTIYALLPDHFHRLKTVGRLDKDSTGLLILTNDGDAAQKLSHPSRQKVKTYEVKLNRKLSDSDLDKISTGVHLDDGLSRMEIEKGNPLIVRLIEGRNRQIRRTFEVMGYKVVNLHRTGFGMVKLENLPEGEWRKVSKGELGL
jgi:23S rRNA pseudouridine2605 synthase